MNESDLKWIRNRLAGLV